VFAVVGGALAFKAKTLHKFYTLSTNGFCASSTSLNYTTQFQAGDVTFSIPYSTISIPNGTSGNPDAPCNTAQVKDTQ
jgi:hypothetical protein